MNGLDTQWILVDAAATTLEFAVNWLLQSTLLIGTGLAIGALLRKRGSAAQSVVYRTTMVAVIVCPLATWILAQLGVSGWSVELPSGWGYELVEAEVPIADEIDEPKADIVPTVAESDASAAAPTESLPPAFGEQMFAGRTGFEPAEPEALGVDTSPAIELSPAAPAEDIPEPVLVEVPAVHDFGLVAAGLGVAWLLVSLVLAMRLVIASRRLSRLRRRAARADDDTIATCHEVASTIRVMAPYVLRSPYLPSPCLAGLRRPAVLLPDAELAMHVRDVLIHELAHLKRHDCHWNLVRQLAGAVFFFQPLLWKLSSLLESTAEEVCDDYVVQLGGDRQEYAHRLVDIAELSSAPIAAAGVGIVSLRSMLAKRVSRITDTSRVLSTRVGNLLLLAVLLGGLVGTGVVGLVGINPKDSQAKVESGDAEVDGEPDRDTITESEEEGDTISVHGKVVDPDGKPAVGARVYAAWVFVGDGRFPLVQNTSVKFEHKIVAEAVCDASGDFSLSFSLENPKPGRPGLSWHIAAYAPDEGAAWVRDVQAWKDRAPTLKLTRDESVRGRIVDLEGKPLAGVQVRVHGVYPAKSEQAVLDWIATAHERTPPAELADYMNMSVTANSGIYAEQFPREWQDGALYQGAPALPADVRTDEAGRFQFQGFGENRLVMLEVAGPTISKCYLHVVNRDMEPLSAKPLNFTGVRSGTYFGREFEYVAEPTQPIEGTVTDIETGEPLADAEIRLGQFAGNAFAQSDFLTTRTDEEGHFRLVGAPQGGGHRIDVDPRPDQPYFPTDKTLPTTPDSFEPIRCDFSLRQGKWITGTVVERVTGKPIGDVTVEYLPLRSNQYVPDYPNYDPEITGAAPEDRYRTDERGAFCVLAIPGAGVLAAIAQGELEQKYSRLSRNQVPDHLMGEGPMLNTYHPWTVVGYNALREVEVPESEEDVEYDLQLNRGATRRVVIVDTAGAQVVGARILGRTFPPRLEKPLEGSEVELIGLRANDERTVAVIHPDRRIGKTLKMAPGADTTIELEPCAAARGRFVNEDGEPIRDVEVGVSIDHSDNWARMLVSDTTDEEGRFEVLLAPGMKYRVFHYTGGGPQFSAECDPRAGAVFELGDLADGTKLTADQTAGMIVDGGEVATAKPQAARGEKVITVRGTVVDSEGKPVKGATVRLPNDVDELAPITQTDSEGRFEIPFDKSKFPDPEWHTEKWRTAKLIATAPGYGPAWVSGEDLNSSDDFTLKLVHDEPIRGQILDLEGQPVPQARVEILQVLDPYSGSLDEYLAVQRDDPQREQSYRNNEFHFLPPKWLDLQPSLEEGKDGPLIKTDDQGRFELRGIGSEHLVRFQVEGPNIDSLPISVITRREVAEEWKRSGLTETARRILDSGGAVPKVYPATFTHFAGPSYPITGIVRDKVTGEPIAGILVAGWLRNTDNHARSTTDENGRYELQGLSVEGTLQQLYAGPSREDPDGLPYVGAEKERISFSPSNPLTADDTDFELTRGTVVRGTVVDAATGEPVKARVEYLAHGDNPHLQELTVPLWPYCNATTDDHGKFSIVVISGPGSLAVWTHLSSALPDRYCPAAPEEFGLPVGDDGFVHTANMGLVRPERYKAAKFIDIEPDTPPTEVEFVVHPVTEVTRVRCVDAQGKVILGVAVVGHLPWSGDGEVIPQGGLEVGRGDATYIEVSDLHAKDRRPVIFYHHDLKLAATLFPDNDSRQPRLEDLSRDPDGTYRITLRPWGTITGRLVNADGDPARGTRVGVAMSSASDPSEFLLEIDTVPVDLEGRFEFKRIPAGGPYLIGVGGGEYTGHFVRQNLQIEPGETIGLGTIDVTSDDRPQPVRMVVGVADADTKEESAKPQAADEKTFEYAGKVVNPAGNPVAGAEIYFSYWVPNASPDYRAKPKATTDAKGEFQFKAGESEFADGETNAISYARLIAKAEGYGFASGLSTAFETTGQAIKKLSPQALSYFNQRGQKADRVLRLVADDTPIEATIIDSDGQPVAGARVRVDRLWWNESGTLDAWEQAAQEEKADFYSLRAQTPVILNGPQIAMVVPEVQTNTKGEFVLRGVGTDRIVQLMISGPRIETSLVKTRTRAGDTIVVPNEWRNRDRMGHRDETYYGAHFTYVAGPSQPVVGRIVDADSKQPIPGVRVSAGFEGTFIAGGKPYISALTDADGNYRLEGLSVGQRERMRVSPPPDSNYMPVGGGITTKLDSEETRRDFRLKRGVLVRGQAIDDRTGKPVPGRVQYVAAGDNPHLNVYDRFVGCEFHERRTDAEGRFEIPVLPGVGIVTFTALDHTSYRRGFGAETISVAARDQRDGIKMFQTVPYILISANEDVLEQVDPEVGSPPLEIELRLTSGVNIVGRLVDPSGQSLQGGIVSGNIYENSWYPIRGETFRVEGYYEDRPRDLFFYHPERDLGGYYHLEGAPPEELVVKLQETGRIRGRLVDEDGAPLADVVLWGEGVPNENYGDADMRLGTDSEGRFEVRGLLPGREYTVKDHSGHVALKEATVEAGETKDVGDVRLQIPREVTGEKPARSPKAAATTKKLPFQSREEEALANSQPEGQPTEIKVSGRVLDPDGKPFPGAQIFTPSFRVKKPAVLEDVKLVEHAPTDAEGRFSFTVSLANIPQHMDKLQVVAYANGYGIAGAQVQLRGIQQDISLQLVPEKLVRGRILDTEGRPVAGVHLRADAIMLPKEAQLDEFLNGWTHGWQDATSRIQNRAYFVSRDDRFCYATTDEQGQFEIHGIGAERIAWLTVFGGGIAQARLFVVTRDGVDYAALNKAAVDQIPTDLRIPGQPVPLVGPTFEHVVEPADTIEGVVVDADTGEPVPDAVAFSGLGFDSAVTDRADRTGKFRLTGLPQQKSLGLIVQPPADSSLLEYAVSLDNPPGLEPIPVEAKLQRGVIVTGQLVDRQTGKGIAGGLRIVPLPGNEWFNKPGYDSYQRSHLSTSTDAEGNFRLISIPGPVVLMAQANAQGLKIGDRPVSPYVQADFDAEDRDKLPVTVDGEDRYFTAANNSIESVDNENAIKYLDLQLQDEPTQCILYVERGRQADIKLLDDQGNRLPGVVVAGLTEDWPITYELPDSRCTLLGLNDRRPRHVLFFHRARHFAGSMEVNPSETPPSEYRLQPAPRIVGRAVDSEGQPLSHSTFELWIDNDTARELERFLSQSREPLETDENGRFEINEVVAGYSFRLACGPGNSKLISPRIANRPEDSADGVLDLGDVKLVPREDLTTSKKKSSPDKSTKNPHNVHGRITLPNGQPAPNAHVAVIAMRVESRQGGDLSPSGEVLAEGITDDGGNYRLDLTDVSSNTYRYANLIARKDGRGIAWKQLNLDATDADVTLELAPEEPIRGKLVDIEGQPAAGVRILVQGVMKRADGDFTPQEGAGYRGEEPVPAAWLQPMTTDGQGRFTVLGVPPGVGVFLNVEGSDRFAPQGISLNTGMAEQRGEHDGTYRPLVRNVQDGEEAVLPLAPAQLIEGVVTYEDTGNPHRTRDSPSGPASRNLVRWFLLAERRMRKATIALVRSLESVSV